MDLKCVRSVGLKTFGVGIMFAFFQIVGNLPDAKHLLIMNVIWLVR